MSYGNKIGSQGFEQKIDQQSIINSLLEEGFKLEDIMKYSKYCNWNYNKMHSCLIMKSCISKGEDK